MGRRNNDKKQNKRKALSIKGIDLTIVFVSLFLSVFCLVFVYSASAFEGKGKTQFLNLITVTDSEKLLLKTVGFIFIGLVLMFIITVVNFKELKDRHPFIHNLLFRFPWGYYLLSIGFFLFIGIMKNLGSDSGGEGAEAVTVGLGMIRKANGAYRWINIYPHASISYQPSEVVKFLLIIAFSIIIFNAGMMLNKKRGILLYLILAAIPAACVFEFSSDLSSSIVIFSVLVFMMIVAGNNLKNTIIVLAPFIIMAALVLVLAIAFNKGKPETDIHPYQAKRILAWIYPDDYPATSDQTTQAMYAIGSGGLFGEGIGNSMQKIKKLPEAQNDMIFALICEELGLFGGLLVIMLYAVLLFRMYIIALSTEDMFERMIVVGVIAHVALQVIINVCVVTRLFPNTGLPLPLISSGGSSIMFMYAELGMVLNIGKNIERA